MSTLKDTFILNTYTGVIHSDGPLSDTGQSNLYDGVGNKSSLDVGQDGKGIAVNGVGFPLGSPTTNGIIAANSSSQLRYTTLSDLLSALGGDIADGTYENPTLVFKDNVLVDVVSSPAPVTGGLKAFKYSATTSASFTVPAGVRRVKITMTGGGSAGGDRAGGAAGTVIGYMSVVPYQVFDITVGAGATTKDTSGEQTNIKYNGDVLAIADGGYSISISGAEGSITSVGLNYITSYTIIPGGNGFIDTDGGGDEESVGGASFWGTAPAYGGGSGAHSDSPVGAGGNGFVLIEW